MLAKDHFVDVMDDPDLRFGIYQIRPRTLDEALKAALEIEAFQTAEKQRNFTGRRAVRAVGGLDNRQGSPVVNTHIGLSSENKVKATGVDMKDLQDMLRALKEEVKTLKERVKEDPPRNRRWGKGAARAGGNPSYTEDGTPICFRGRKPGHMKRDCPEAREVSQEPQRATEEKRQHRETLNCRGWGSHPGSRRRT